MPDDPLGLLVAVVIGIVVLVAAPFVLLPLLVVVELLLLLLLVPVAVLGRVVLGRRWCVEVRKGWTPWTERPAGDWQAGSLLIHELADRIRSGQVPDRTLGPTRDSAT